ncbi:type I methionyl aminopeptidase [Patescibacteria group bacterium]|nr:type I methionyl aminopeptidase [Patescibacteria group bacterium]
MLKRKPNVEALKESGRITTAVLVRLSKEAKPGVTEQELDTLAEKMIRDAGGTPAFLGHQGFPGSVCISVNDEIVHGIPSDRKLQEGDLVSFDVGVKIDGWYTDAALTAEVGTVSKEVRHLRLVTNQSLEIALKEARPGRTTGDLGAAVQKYVESEGLGVIRDCVGHGIGKKLHEDPSIPNFGTAGEGAGFKEGMVVAIEPMVTLGDYALTQAPDKWTLKTADGRPGSHVEETVMITDGEPLRFTPAQAALASEKADDTLVNATHSDETSELSEGF